MPSIEYRIRRTQLYAWLVSAIVTPILAVTGTYYGLKMEIQELKSEIESHESTSQLMMKAAESTHLTFNNRISILENGDKEIERFIAMIKGKLNL